MSLLVIVLISVLITYFGIKIISLNYGYEKVIYRFNNFEIEQSFHKELKMHKDLLTVYDKSRSTFNLTIFTQIIEKQNVIFDILKNDINNLHNMDKFRIGDFIKIQEKLLRGINQYEMNENSICMTIQFFQDVSNYINEISTKIQKVGKLN